jgi:AcrR family transcriptional regulator
MAPRRYQQHLRADSAARTRAAILRAAAEVYRERGVANSTVQAIAQRADVARGTVVNHFGTADALLEAVLDQAVAEVAFPDAQRLAGARTAGQRARMYVEEMFRFFDRSAEWWAVFNADMGLPALQARERAYDEVVRRLRVAAFGPLVDDRQVAASIRAFVDYAPMYGLLGAGLTLDESIEVVSLALLAVVDRRTAETRAKGRKSKEATR